MFKAVVGGTRKHHVGPAQLLDVAQPLELRSVDDANQQRRNLNVAVYGVTEDLQNREVADVIGLTKIFLYIQPTYCETTWLNF